MTPGFVSSILALCMVFTAFMRPEQVNCRRPHKRKLRMSDLDPL